LGAEVSIPQDVRHGKCFISGVSPHPEEHLMDLLLLLLIVFAVVSVAGWGYGTYAPRPAPAGGVVVAEPAWASPLGLIGLLAVIAIVVMLFTNWRPLGPVW
jgi:hypothetical protein